MMVMAITLHNRHHHLDNVVLVDKGHLLVVRALVVTVVVTVEAVVVRRPVVIEAEKANLLCLSLLSLLLLLRLLLPLMPPSLPPQTAGPVAALQITHPPPPFPRPLPLNNTHIHNKPLV